MFGVGSNCDGAFGADGHVPFATPTSPDFPAALREPEPSRVVEISSGGLDHPLARIEGGRLLGWGVNHGQFGPDDPQLIFAPHLVALPPGETVLQLSAGLRHVVLLGAAGRVFVAGQNDRAQLGIGATDTDFHAGWIEVDLSTFCR